MGQRYGVWVGEGSKVANDRGIRRALVEHMHNTFDRPDTVRQRDAATDRVSGSLVTHTFPPASVTRLTIDLG